MPRLIVKCSQTLLVFHMLNSCFDFNLISPCCMVCVVWWYDVCCMLCVVCVLWCGLCVMIWCVFSGVFFCFLVWCVMFCGLFVCVLGGGMVCVLAGRAGTTGRKLAFTLRLIRFSTSSHTAVLMHHRSLPTIFLL